MVRPRREQFNTTIDASLLRELKILSVERNQKYNELLEEAVRLLLTQDQRKKGRHAK